ncbi:MAG: HlyC/CorC family transporter [Alphaproteobacteria bacterium]|nr:HlyC/CorC family transporter [Alphaproteobacteria bacterium]
MSEAAKPNLLSKLKNRLNPKKSDLSASLEGMMESHAAQSGAPALDGDARSMMRNVIGFSDRRVKDLMVPRVNIVAVEEMATMRELLAQFIDANHSRLPIYRESLDDIAGMIHVKDFLRWMLAKGKKKKTRASAESGLDLAAKELSSTVKSHGSLLREVLFVPPSMPAPDLLLKMKASHIHLAIVVDEYGGTDGIVSLEDLVEEIIGDISDEHDIDEEQDMLRKLDEQTYLANAQLEISKLEDILGLALLPEDKKDEADTLGGLVFEMAGRVPARGEIIKHPSGLEFEIADSDARRIKRVKIHAAPLASPEAGEDSAGG